MRFDECIPTQKERVKLNDVLDAKALLEDVRKVASSQSTNITFLDAEPCLHAESKMSTQLDRTLVSVRSSRESIVYAMFD